jgi:hypothetical protein
VVCASGCPRVGARSVHWLGKQAKGEARQEGSNGGAAALVLMRGEADMAFIAKRVVVSVFRARQGNGVAVWHMVRCDDVRWEGRQCVAADRPMAQGGAAIRHVRAWRVAPA